MNARQRERLAVIQTALAALCAELREARQAAPSGGKAGYRYALRHMERAYGQLDSAARDADRRGDG